MKVKSNSVNEYQILLFETLVGYDALPFRKFQFITRHHSFAIWPEIALNKAGVP